MRKKIKDQLFSKFTHQLSEARVGFSRLSRDEDPLFPAGMVMRRKTSDSRWQFLAVIAHEELDAFRVILAWGAASEFPDADRDFSVPVKKLLLQDTGQCAFAEIVPGTPAWVNLDPARSRHDARMAEWREAAVKAAQDGAPLPRPPAQSLAKTTPVEEVTSCLDEIVGRVCDQLSNFALPMLKK